MATTKIGICNLALRKLKLKTITALTEENDSARTMTDIYEYILKEVLCEHPWNFAIKRVLLDTPSGTAPVYEFTYAFDLPVDCLRVINTEDNVKYQVENGKLLCDSSTVNIKYIYYCDDVTLYSQNFIAVFALRLAYEMAYSQAGSPEMRQILAQDDARKLGKSKSVDGQESPVEDESENGSWLDSRR